jgi:hypothetical protein
VRGREVADRRRTMSFTPLPQHRTEQTRITTGRIVLWFILANIAFWPRAWIIGFWIFSRDLGQAFSSWVIVALGFILLPCTTLIYAWMWAIDSDGVHGAEWLFVAVAFVFDLFFWVAAISSRPRS